MNVWVDRLRGKARSQVCAVAGHRTHQVPPVQTQSWRGHPSPVFTRLWSPCVHFHRAVRTSMRLNAGDRVQPELAGSESWASRGYDLAGIQATVKFGVECLGVCELIFENDDRRAGLPKRCLGRRVRALWQPFVVDSASNGGVRLLSGGGRAGLPRRGFEEILVLSRGFGLRCPCCRPGSPRRRICRSDHRRQNRSSSESTPFTGTAGGLVPEAVGQHIVESTPVAIRR